MQLPRAVAEHRTSPSGAVATGWNGLRSMAMNELIFLVEEAPEGGYVARALGASIFTEGNDVATLEQNVRDAVRCHFDEGEIPRIVRLHFTREEVITV